MDEASRVLVGRLRARRSPDAGASRAMTSKAFSSSRGSLIGRRLGTRGSRCNAASLAASYKHDQHHSRCRRHDLLVLRCPHQESPRDPGGRRRGSRLEDAKRRHRARGGSLERPVDRAARPGRVCGAASFRRATDIATNRLLLRLTSNRCAAERVSRSRGRAPGKVLKRAPHELRRQMLPDLDRRGDGQPRPTPTDTRRRATGTAGRTWSSAFRATRFTRGPLGVL